MVRYCCYTASYLTIYIIYKVYTNCNTFSNKNGVKFTIKILPFSC
nr:MAG TPA: conotoxin [Caudoviricetes sp.]